MITFDRVKSNLSDVTNAQIGKAHKIIHFNTGEEYYLVENSKGEFDDECQLIEYKVQYSTEYGFTCTCKSGQFGFANVYHPSGCCWHVRASVAAWLEEEAALAEMREKIEAEKKAKIETQAHGKSTIEAQMPAWVMNAKPAPHMRKAPRER
jgi:hypothetical protein